MTGAETAPVIEPKAKIVGGTVAEGVDKPDRPGGTVPILELKALSKSFGGLQAVRNVSLQIMPGDRKAVIGPNGAGKTTLFNVITGIFPATSGQILLLDRKSTRLNSSH